MASAGASAAATGAALGTAARAALGAVDPATVVGPRVPAGATGRLLRGEVVEVRGSEGDHHGGRPALPRVTRGRVQQRLVQGVGPALVQRARVIHLDALGEVEAGATRRRHQALDQRQRLPRHIPADAGTAVRVGLADPELAQTPGRERVPCQRVRAAHPVAYPVAEILDPASIRLLESLAQQLVVAGPGGRQEFLELRGDHGLLLRGHPLAVRLLPGLLAFLGGATPLRLTPLGLQPLPLLLPLPLFLFLAALPLTLGVRAVRSVGPVLAGLLILRALLILLILRPAVITARTIAGTVGRTGGDVPGRARLTEGHLRAPDAVEGLLAGQAQTAHQELPRLVRADHVAGVVHPRQVGDDLVDELLGTHRLLQAFDRGNDRGEVLGAHVRGHQVRQRDKGVGGSIQRRGHGFRTRGGVRLRARSRRRRIFAPNIRTPGRFRDSFPVIHGCTPPLPDWKSLRSATTPPNRRTLQ